jgi:hypothetical protein
MPQNDNNNLNTEYDDAFRTLLTDCPHLIIPVVNEMFGENYTGSERITELQNEQFQIETDNYSLKERITDSSFEIEREGDIRRYHIECQSTEDGSMLVRMFEYDSQIALDEREQTRETLTVRFPRSGVISLRHTKNTPDDMKMRIITPGGEVSYNIPVLKVKDYSVEEIFDRELYFIIPFHIFVYESKFPRMEHNPDMLQEVQKEYAGIMERLEEALHKGKITEFDKKAVCIMSERVLKKIADKYSNVREGVGVYMGGKVLDYEAKDIRNSGIAEGIRLGKEAGIREGKEAGIREGKEAGIREGKYAAVTELEKNSYAEDVACDMLNVNLEDYKAYKKENDIVISRITLQVPGKSR